MFPRLFTFRCRRAAFLTLAAVLLYLGLVQNTHAQQQESGMLDRINNADRTMAFPLSNKNFGKTASFRNKEASIKTFAFAKGASLAGDGSFKTKSFSSTAYQAKTFNPGDGAAAGQKSFAQNNKLFDTNGFDVRDARDAGKSAAVRSYNLHTPFELRGKRQDTYDDLLKRKKLSIEEVRELLNKNK